MQGNMPVLILAIVVRLCYANKHGLPSWEANVDFLKAIVQRYTVCVEGLTELLEELPSS